MLFIPCDKWKKLFFIKFYRYSEVLFNHYVLAFFWNKWFERSPYFLFCLHNINTKVKVQCKHQSSKMKLSYVMLIKSSKTTLFFDPPHFTLQMKSFLMHHILLYKWNLFLKLDKTSLEACLRKLQGRSFIFINNNYANFFKSHWRSHEIQNRTDKKRTQKDEKLVF